MPADSSNRLQSVLSACMEKFLQEKHACGYAYHEATRILRRLDDFLVQEGLTIQELPGSVARKWLAKKAHESAGTHQQRITVTRQFSRFLLRLGHSAYVPDFTLATRNRSSFVPRMLTDGELRKFFRAVDALEPTARSPLRHLIMPEVFRLLYGCGFRVGEVLKLRVRDVDLNQGILTVRQGKFRKDRLVPPVLPLVNRLRKYAANFEKRSPDAIFFPRPNGGPFSLRTVYTLFRQLLLQCGISHGGRGKGPRIHDARHQFAVQALRRWYQDGEDLDAKLPLLATYLGHVNLSGTQHYLLHVTSFLTHYLAAQRNVSPNTIKAYRDVFTLLLRFCRDVQGIALEKLRLEQIDVSFVEAFLDYLERERKSSPRTRNQRLAALHAFFRYVQAEEPTLMHQCQKILAIPLRRHTRPTVSYLSKEELAEILARPDLRTPEGRRDAVLLSVLYDTGARVQELVDLSVGDVRLDPPAQIRLLGKGRKMRAVPLMANTVQLLRSHMQENHLDRPEQFDKPLFHNARHERLTRSGIRYILHKYVVLARSKCPSLNRTVSPHTLRHTKGMHLLQSGVSLDMIRDFLGHVDAKTTQIYARANLEMKRKALEKISEPSLVQTIPCWQQNKDLLDWLHSL